MNWAALNGTFQFEQRRVKFVGGALQIGEQSGAAVGLAISNQSFSGGAISADVTFDSVDDKSACSIVFWYHPERRFFVSAGISSDPAALFGIWHFDNRWTIHTALGDGRQLEAERKYHLEVQLRGSRASLAVDGIGVAAATLPFTLPPSQVGVWCRGLGNITVESYKVISEVPRVFVVMEFGSPFDEIHKEVLKTVCNEFDLEAVRADETFGPGLIIADIEKQIQEAKFIIADITPPNPNVYYEVGYARAINKPTILLANSSVERLPFDVSPFRTLFYSNTIAGKAEVEDGLRRHIRAVLNQSTI
jgi:hypothetical protein